MPERPRRFARPQPNPAHVDPTWPEYDSGESPVSEFAAPQQGAVSPFGTGIEFPLPVERLGYVHPSPEDRPNHAGR